MPCHWPWQGLLMLPIVLHACPESIRLQQVSVCADKPGSISFKARALMVPDLDGLLSIPLYCKSHTRLYSKLSSCRMVV